MGRLAELERKLENAPKPLRDLADQLADQLDRQLDQNADDQAWDALLGPAYTAGQVARLLGITQQAVGQRRGLLRLTQRNGRVAYPVMQFDGDAPLDGIDATVATLSPVVGSAWTIASWLAGPNPDLEGRTPVQALRDGDRERVLALARRFKHALQR